MASEASNFLINNSRNIMNAVDSASSEDVEATIPKGYCNKGDEAYLFGWPRFIFEYFAFLE